MKEFTLEEVAEHNRDGDLFIVVDAKVYNLSKFSAFHPGGKSVLLDDDVRGKDSDSYPVAHHFFRDLPATSRDSYSSERLAQLATRDLLTALSIVFISKF